MWHACRSQGSPETPPDRPTPACGGPGRWRLRDVTVTRGSPSGPFEDKPNGSCWPKDPFVRSLQPENRALLSRRTSQLSAMDIRGQTMDHTADWTALASCRRSDPDALFVQGAAQNQAKTV